MSIIKLSHGFPNLHLFLSSMNSYFNTGKRTSSVGKTRLRPQNKRKGTNRGRSVDIADRATHIIRLRKTIPADPQTSANSHPPGSYNRWLRCSVRPQTSSSLFRSIKRD
ncbi:hypothetical protein GWI33_008972 [Rhynchophorus ferrugineus]|uniref:Uncharacterized protein n=1 Tax=Rhynchophorus ferrugineus TaxID=354439 RepID=A0A834IHG9_RHYFE|nr:hypothetical protein GWI33_008972 [Rhynchophorus ferrugineus]